MHGVRMGTQSKQLAAGYAAWSIDIATSLPDGSPVGRVEGGKSPRQQLCLSGNVDNVVDEEIE